MIEITTYLNNTNWPTHILVILSYILGGSLLWVTFAGSVLKDDVVNCDVTSHWWTSGGLEHDLGSQ